MRKLWRRLWRRTPSAGPAGSDAADGPRIAPSSVEELATIAQTFAERWNIHFHDPELLRQALTHRSYIGESGLSQVASNERMEFLGDSVLELVVNEFLYRRYPDSREGDLTKKRSLLVSRSVLAQRAHAVGLGGALLLSGAEQESGGRARDSILADSIEAVIGAVYLDQGLDVARVFIHDALLDAADDILSDEEHVNFKSLLQELVQSASRSQPRYRVCSETGPDHEKTFVLEVLVKGEVMGRGAGRNKKEAEQRAARDALRTLGTRGVAAPPEGT